MHKNIGKNNTIINLNKMEDDPQRRRPDITVARKNLGWSPQVPLLEGLEKTIRYFRAELDKEHVKFEDPAEKAIFSALYLTSEEVMIDSQSSSSKLEL